MPGPDVTIPGSKQRVGVSILIQWVLVVAGGAIAAYLVWVHYQQDALVCGLGDCEKVQTSTYAEFAGIPIAWFGLALYLALALLLAARRFRIVAQDIAAILIVGATFAGTLGVAWLTYLELWVIHAICQWCVAFAITTLLFFITALLDLRDLFTSPDDTPEGFR